MFNASCLKIMLSCPSDVKEEISIFKEVVHNWNSINSEDKKIVLIPIHWKNTVFSTSGDSPQEVINNQLLNKADILVSIFRIRIGSPTENYLSGTIEEISKFIESKKDVSLYIFDGKIDVNEFNNENDIYQFKKLKDFITNNEPYRGIYKKYSDINDFQKIFNNDLQRIMIVKNDKLKEENITIPKTETLLDISKFILLKLQENKDDPILLKLPNSASLTQYYYHIGTKSYPEKNNFEELSHFEKGIKQLIELGYLENNNHRRKNSWVMTSDGFNFKL